MLVTGSINTLSVKWADTMTSESSDGVIRGFNHPFLQASGMFLGEMSCMLAFFVVRFYKGKTQTPSQNAADPMMQARNFSPLIFLLPALCDMTATSTMYIGLSLTFASSFQMLRGAVIVFTGLFSRFFLRRMLGLTKWIGIVFVIAGLAIVGCCDMIYMPSGGGNDTLNALEAPLFHSEYIGNLIRGASSSLGLEGATHSGSEILIGDLMIIGAQVIVAVQMVLEEKFVSKYNVPALQAVGWEGTFGFLTLSALLIPMYFIPVGEKFGQNPRHVLEDAYDGLYQLGHNPLLLTAFMGTIVSIAFFNFAGISVTKEMSATTRMVLDSVRTLVIWGVSLGVGWQVFHALQLLGFAMLVTGMCVYNDLLFVPLIRKARARLGYTTMPDQPIDANAEEGENTSQADDEERQNIFAPEA